MRRTLPWLLLPLAVLGVWLALDLTATHFKLLYHPEVKLDAWCDVNQTFSCSQVNSSKFSSVSFGAGRELPVAIPAVGFFLATGLLGLLALRREDETARQRDLGAVVLLSVPGVLFGLYLIVIQAFVLHAWCLKCLLMDATTLSTLAVAWFAHGGGAASIVRSVLPPPASAGLAGAVFLLGSGLAWANYLQDVQEAPRQKKLSDQGGGSAEGSASAEPKGTSAEEEAKALEEARKAITEFASTFPTLPVKEIPIFPWDGVKGNELGPITVVEFADFECPHCKMAAFFMKDIAQKYKEQVRFVFKNYPLSKKCNDSLSRDVHPISCDIALAVTCGGREGRFWELHDMAFDKQGSLDEDELSGLGKEVGIPEDRLAACIADETVLTQVREQVAVGRALGLQGTPAFFVNGREMPSPHPAFVEAAIRKELKGRGVTEFPPDPDGLYTGI